MAIEKFEVGKSYKWDKYAIDYDYFVVQDLFDGRVYYNYPEWNEGKGHSDSVVVLYVDKSEVIEYTPEKENKLELSAVIMDKKDGAVRNVVVGQVWKWYSWSDDSFEVLEIDGDNILIKYLLSGNHRHVNLEFWDDQTLLVEDAPEENNALSPNVYQFPNGVEVKDISAHLTSFGGQAVQYIARATRLDGVVKGLPVQDIRKAIQLLEWEAERLEAK